MASLGRALLQADPVGSFQETQGNVLELKERAQKMRATEVSIQKEQAEFAKSKERISINSLRSMSANASDNQFKHLLGVAEGLGVDLSNDSISRGDLGEFFNFLNTDTGKRVVVENTTMGLNEVRADIKKLDGVIKAGVVQQGDKEIKLNPKQLEAMQAQKAQLLQKENLAVNTLQQLGIEEKADKVSEGATKTINAIHEAQTGVPFSQGTPESKQSALKEQQSRQVEVAGERGRAAADIKRTEAVNKAIAALDNTKLIVNTLDQLSESIITADSALGAVTQRVKLSAGALSKANEVAATYADQREQFTGVLSRSLGGEKGVLTDRDIARITRGLPQFGDTKAIRDFKMGTIRLLIDTAIESQKRLLNNKPQSPDISKRLNDLFNRLETSSTGKGKSKTASEFLKNKGL